MKELSKQSYLSYSPVVDAFSKNLNECGIGQDHQIFSLMRSIVTIKYKEANQHFEMVVIGSLVENAMH